MKLLKIFSLVLFLSISSQQSYAQLARFASPNNMKEWASNAFEHSVFVENNSQFDSESSIGKRLKESFNTSVLYSASSGGVDIYFSSNSLIYCHDNIKTLNSSTEKHERKGSERKEKTGKTTEVEHQYLQLQWIGSDPGAEIYASDLQTCYYTYASEKDNGQTTIKARCFKKITYKSIYPNIDIEYILPEKGGVKYSIILHPGADISKIKMHYKNAKGLKTDIESNIIIRSEFGDFVDHAPSSFYEDGTNIRSAFELKDNTVSFALNTSTSFQQASNDKQQTIIIDPWTTNPFFTAPNCAYDVNYDLQGNVYIYGSRAPYKLAKLNNAGVILWVYNAVGLGLYNGGYSYGDFAVDEFSGTSYLGETWQVPTARVFKVNTAGFQTGTFAGSNSMDEIWRMEYNRCINKIVIAGGGGTTFNAVALDTNMSNFTSVNVFSTTAVNRDFQLLAIDNQSNFCYMLAGYTAGSTVGVNNAMVKCPVPTLTPTNWMVQGGHKITELGSIRYQYATNMNGMNGMAVSPNWLYTYDSDSLKRWNKNTGAYITGIHVSPIAPKYSTGGSIQIYWGGLSVDECDNIYVGFHNSIKVYNSSLSLINTLALPDTVYDVKLGPNNKLYACGRNFVKEMNTSGNNITVSMTQAPAAGCNACNGTASVSNTLSCGANASSFNYSWSTTPVQTTQTATGLCPGNYTVTLTTSCHVSFTGTITVTGGPGTILTTTSSTSSGCSNNNGTATVSPSGSSGIYTFIWSNGQTSQTATGLSANLYTVTVTDGTCFSVATVIVKSALSLATITPSYLPCNNGGNATAIISNGTSAPFTYNWSNGASTITSSTTNQVSNLPIGTYTVTVTDNNGCTTSQIFSINSNPLTINVQTQNITCTIDGSANIGVTTGVGPFSYSWSNGFNGSSFSGLAQGNYTVTVTDGGGCTATKTFTITGGVSPANASFTVSPGGTICSGTTVNVTHTGSAGTHNWIITPGSTLSGTTTNFSYTFLSAGSYSISHDITNGGCKNTIVAIVNVSSCNGPTVTATGNSVCPGSCAAVSSNPGNGTSPYTYLWSNGSTTQNITPCPASTTTYTLTITDAGGKTATTTALVTVNPPLSITSNSTSISCNGGANGTATVTPGSGTSPFVYNWNNGQTTQTATGLSTGNYTVTVTDSKTCTAITTIAIVSPPPLTAIFTKGTANCIICGCKEWIMVTAANGTGPYNYSWPDGYGKRYQNKLCPGNYTINITDKNGCSVNTTVSAP